MASLGTVATLLNGVNAGLSFISSSISLSKNSSSTSVYVCRVAKTIFDAASFYYCAQRLSIREKIDDLNTVVASAASNQETVEKAKALIEEHVKELGTISAPAAIAFFGSGASKAAELISDGYSVEDSLLSRETLSEMALSFQCFEEYAAATELLPEQSFWGTTSWGIVCLQVSSIKTRSRTAPEILEVRDRAGTIYRIPLPVPDFTEEEEARYKEHPDLKDLECSISFAPIRYPVTIQDEEKPFYDAPELARWLIENRDRPNHPILRNRGPILNVSDLVLDKELYDKIKEVTEGKTAAAAGSTNLLPE